MTGGDAVAVILGATVGVGVIDPHEQAMMTIARMAPARMNQNFLGVIIDILLPKSKMVG